MIYVPILRAKSGEFAALEKQTLGNKAMMTPLLQLVPDVSEKRTNDYKATQVTSIVKAWGFKGNNLFLDPSLYNPETTQLSYPYFTMLRDKGVNCTPVVALNSEDTYIDFLVDNNLLINGICIRIREDFAIPRLVEMTINHYKQKLNIDTDAIDVLIDFGYLGETSMAHYLNSFDKIYAVIQKQTPFRSVIMASGTFPVDVSAYEVNSIQQLPRKEWELYKSIKQNSVGLNIVYSDYGVAHPVYDPYMQAFLGSCSIKYSTEKHYYVFRGARSDKHPDGSGQYKTKSQELTEMSFYPGPAFSWADTHIYECANGEVGPGNAETWVKVSQNRHFSLTLNLL